MHPTRPNTPAIDSTGQNTPYACISRDSDYCITKYKPNLVNNKTPAKAFTPPAEKKIKRLCHCRVNWSKLKSLQIYVVPIWNKVIARNINFLLNNLIHYLSP